MINITQEQERWKNAQYGRDVRQAQIDVNNKLKLGVEDCEEKVVEYGKSETDRNKKVDQALKNVAAAEKAAKDIANQVQAKLDNGEFNGPRGPQGLPGKDGIDGQNGVVVPLSSGMFAMQVIDGHLYVIHNDNEPRPPLSIVDGRLIYTIGGTDNG